MQKQRNWMKIIGAVLLCAMLTGGVILGVRVAKLVDMTLIEARTTPTPVPRVRKTKLPTPFPLVMYSPKAAALASFSI